jgi:hypothetical protein
MKSFYQAGAFCGFALLLAVGLMFLSSPGFTQGQLSEERTPGQADYCFSQLTADSPILLAQKKKPAPKTPNSSQEQCSKNDKACNSRNKDKKQRNKYEEATKNTDELIKEIEKQLELLDDA